MFFNRPDKWPIIDLKKQKFFWIPQQEMCVCCTQTSSFTFSCKFLKFPKFQIQNQSICHWKRLNFPILIEENLTQILVTARYFIKDKKLETEVFETFQTEPPPETLYGGKFQNQIEGLLEKP